jgi:hypothetical protein
MIIGLCFIHHKLHPPPLLPQEAIMTPTYTPTGLSELAVAELRAAVQLKWFRAGEILDRLDLWHSALADSFLAALEEDSDRLVEIPAVEYRDTAYNILENWNNWLGRDVVFSILEDYSELLEVAQ